MNTPRQQDVDDYREFQHRADATATATIYRRGRDRPNPVIPCKAWSHRLIRGHLLDHGLTRLRVFPNRTGVSPSWLAILAGTRFSGMATVAYEKASWAAVRYDRELVGLRWRDPVTGALVLDDDFLVDPGDWIPMARDAFGLDDPPSPREVACVLARWTPLDIAWSAWLPACDLASFMLSTLTRRQDLVARVLDKTPEQHALSVASAIHTMMEQPAFALWAIGSDLTQFETGIARLNVVARIHGHRPRDVFSGTYSLSDERCGMESIHQSHYVQYQLRSGKRLNPVTRGYTGLRRQVVFDTREARDRATSEHYLSCFYREVHRERVWGALPRDAPRPSFTRVAPVGEPPAGWKPARYARKE